MPDPQATGLQHDIQQHYRRVRGLQAMVYAQADPTADRDLHRQKVQEEVKLYQLEQQLDATLPSQEKPPPLGPLHERFLGAETTGLHVEPILNMQTLPTGIYHLLDPDREPLLTVNISNESDRTRRVCIKAFIEGLSAQAVRTIEIEFGRSAPPLRLLPTLFPERARTITEVQRATLHLIVEDLDGNPESYDTFSLTCLARTSSFNGVRRPGTNKVVDLSHYYGAWVTPNVEAVQERIRRAADLWDKRQIWGYQGDRPSVLHQVAALYQSLREAEIVYVNSVIDFGAPPGAFTQRTRLPRESLALKSANCIDGTVLMASLLEGASLNPAIVLVPGHAFLAWQAWEDSNEWGYLETTLLGSADFETACRSGQRQFEDYQQAAPNLWKRHPLPDLRARGIWPME
jgi:hypothetical protein